MRSRDPRRLLPIYKRMLDLEKQIEALTIVAAQQIQAWDSQAQINRHLVTTTNRIEAKWN